MKELEDVAEVIEWAATDPQKAAAIIDQWADELRALAAKIRESTGSDLASTSMIGDKVTISVYGPDGAMRSRGGN